MLDDVQLSIEGLSSSLYLQEVIANNLANVNTVGFKRERLFPNILEEVSEESESNCQEVTVFEQGQLRQTKNPLDLALNGEGFFAIQTSEGMRYTRNGKFHLNSMGQLIINENSVVLGESGPIEVRGDFTVNRRGEIFRQGEMIDRFRIVTFERPYPIKKIGNSLFSPIDDQVEEVEIEDIRIEQGYVEESNVIPIEEMVNMMSLFRYFEAGQKILSTYDDLLDRTVNDIGSV